MVKGPDMTTVENRVRDVIARTFELPEAEAARPDLRLSNPPAWDSIGHMSLVVALEREFGVRFAGYTLPQLVSVDAIVRELSKHVAA
jgi:acyl carrier protein